MGKLIWKNKQDGTTTPLNAENLNLMQDMMFDWFYPIGTIYETTSSALDTVAKMNAHFGGTWEKYGNGRVTVCHTSTSSKFNTIDKTGGSETHTLTKEEMPSHNHAVPGDYTTSDYYVRYTESSTGYGSYNGPTPLRMKVSDSVHDDGGGQPHNNLQPYIVVYRYRRIA